MLLQLREFIATKHWVSLAELARAFHVAPEALEPMLACWVTRGVIARHGAGGCAQRCAGCAPSRPVYYQYVGSSGGNSRGPGIA